MSRKPQELPLAAEWVLTEDQLKAVGCVALESSRLEPLIREFIEALAGPALATLLLDRKMSDAKAKILATALPPRLPNVKLRSA
jgi:hypothetical protein